MKVTSGTSLITPYTLYWCYEIFRQRRNQSIFSVGKPSQETTGILSPESGLVVRHITAEDVACSSLPSKMAGSPASIRTIVRTAWLIHSCGLRARGRADLRRQYHPDRPLQHPSKRVGERGEGQFVRCTWEEALEIIAGQLQRVKHKEQR